MTAANHAGVKWLNVWGYERHDVKGDGIRTLTGRNPSVIYVARPLLYSS